MGRGCPRPVAGRSLRASCPPLAARRLRFAILAALAAEPGFRGTGNPSRILDCEEPGVARVEAGNGNPVRHGICALASWQRGRARARCALADGALSCRASQGRTKEACDP